MSDRSGIEFDALDAYEAIRSINHATIFTGDGIPAPVVYRVLGFLQSAAGYGMAQALGQLARGLERSLSTFDVYEDDGRPPALAHRPRARARTFSTSDVSEDAGRDPAYSGARAVNALTDAADLLQHVGPLLDNAQAAISRQGYRTQGQDAG